MHGMINRAIKVFLQETYGADLWSGVARDAKLEDGRFETMHSYDASATDRVLAAATARLDLPSTMLLEDLGTFLVSQPMTEPIRRLMRFGGEGFLDFLFSLEDLPERIRLVLPDLDLPELELAEPWPGAFLLNCRGGWPGAPHVLLGVLRALADDYGALVLLDMSSAARDAHVISIQLLDPRFSEGRAFTLKGPAP